MVGSGDIFNILDKWYLEQSFTKLKHIFHPCYLPGRFNNHNDQHEVGPPLV